jgi:hypothetical protein
MTDWEQDQKEMRLIARGAHGMTHGSRPKRPRLAMSGPIADMVITKNGREIRVPAAWFTKTGQLRKSFQSAYRLLTVDRTPVFIVYPGE